jgi:hypothetical protein
MRFALIAEGPADSPFVPVLIRLCRSLGADDIQGEYIENSGVGRRISTRVATLLEDDPEFDLLFVHVDGDNEGLVVRRSRIDEALEQCGRPRPYARVVPVRATESWLLVDVEQIRVVAGFPEGTTPLNLPKLSHIETAKDVKSRLRDALSRAKRPRRHQKNKHEISLIDDREYARLRNDLLEQLNIHGPVTQLSAWQALVEDTKAALASLSHPAP